MAFDVDVRLVESELEALPTPVRLQLELKLKSLAKFAELTPPPAPAFLLLEGIDPATVFRFDLAGYRVRYEVDPDGRVLRALRISKASSATAG